MLRTIASPENLNQHTTIQAIQEMNSFKRNNKFKHFDLFFGGTALANDMKLSDILSPLVITVLPRGDP